MTKINTLSPIVLFTHKKSNNLKPILGSLPSIKKRKIYIVSDPEQNEMEKLFVKETKELIQSHPQSFFFEWIIPNSHKGVLHIFDYALDIVFEKEKQAIILEDDTIPSPKFFKYCEQMLEKHENNSQIGSIIGTNLGALHDAEMYCTVPIGMPFWGWATWADRWKSMPKDYSFWDRFIL
ncbi:MAG: hypothetical protein K9H61_07805, partial [Bacteroidia bacterium]|nr:hypothetical protein [Bacteroidia bacterium]